MAYKYAYDDEEKKYTPPKLKTNRSALKLFVFGSLTMGIYIIFFFMPLPYDLDKVNPPRERGKTMSFLLAAVLSVITLKIAMWAWHHHIADRTEEALTRRGIDYDFGPDDFWKWYVLGSFIIVGPFIYFHKLCKAMNLLCQDYNEKPELD